MKKKLITICVVVGICLAISAAANAAVTYKTHLVSGDTGAVSYGAGDPDWPTPHMAAKYNPPAVKTSFLPTDDIWVAVQLDLTALEDSTDDDGDGFFDFTAEFYDPINTLRFTYDEQSTWGTTWATVGGWRDTEDPLGTPKWTSLDLWTAGASGESLKDQVSGSLNPGVWNVKVYVEACNLNTGSFTVVPAPGAILLGGIGVVLIGWLKRRRSI